MINVSFIITNYNYESFVEKCILSCLTQEKTDLTYEVIIVDDGSNDDSLLTINQYDKCRIIKSVNAGVEKAANLGIECANGIFVVRVDADDLVSPLYLHHVQRFMHYDVDVLYGDYTEIDQFDQTLGIVKLPDYDPTEVLSRGDFLATGTLMKRDTVRRLGSYNSRFKNNGLESYELIIKMISSGSHFMKINENIFYYRHHDKNMSMLRKDQILQYGQKIFSDHKLGNYNINEFHPYMKRAVS